MRRVPEGRHNAQLVRQRSRHEWPDGTFTSDYRGLRPVWSLFRVRGYVTELSSPGCLSPCSQVLRGRDNARTLVRAGNQ
jgi:hypothetical protein